MDTSRIDDFIHVMQNPSTPIIVRGKIRRGENFHEFNKSIICKEREFEKCIIELCLVYGDNVNKALSIYRDKLISVRSRYKVFIKNAKNDEPKFVRSFYMLMWDIAQMAIKYIDKIINKEENVVNTPTYAKKQKMQNTSDVYYATNYTNKQLRRVYKYLIDNGHLEADNLLSDFIYFFTGRGKKVNDCLKWKSSKVGLAYFIDAIIVKGGTKDKQFWKKAETIFRESNLANKYSQSVKNKDNSQNEKIANDIKRLLKIK